tara:strand:+ start:648 stop:902 length:255 start_codon:yes stop_codon:yes gene_type:complete
MNGLFRALKITTYKDVDTILEEFRTVEKGIRDTKRQEAFEAMNKLDPTIEGLKIKEIMVNLQNELDMSNSLEQALLSFTNKLKS